MYKATKLEIPDVILIEPQIFADERGFFYESFNAKRFKELKGVDVEFVQDNHSKSKKNVLRGLHYQIEPKAQGKLVRVVSGEVFDVAVDIRPESTTFGKWVSALLSEQNKRMLWVPAGFAHGFLTLSENAELIYKTTDFWSQEHERCIRWNDPRLGIEWPLNGVEPMMAVKDSMASGLSDPVID